MPLHDEVASADPARPDAVAASGEPPPARRAGPPRSFDEFEMRVLSATEGACCAPAAGRAGQRAATLARRAGACDHLITAALVHDFARYFDGREEACVARRSADLLAAVFPAPVLEPMRSLARSGAAPDEAGAAPPRHAVAQGRRLRAYIDAAAGGSDEPLLPWPTLLGIARRASLDG